MAGSQARLLVFQHIACEHPGVFREFLAADGIAWEAVELDEGDAIPDLESYDGLWVMGGPMDVWQEEEHPWLKAEKVAIREAVADRRLPFMGLCLGHQLLAEALGGAVGPAEQAEIGILDVALTERGRQSPFYAGLAERGACLQWHSAEVTRAPQGAAVLAESPACAVQALSFGEAARPHAFSLQYHVEITPDTVGEWGQVPAYRQALEKALGPDALGRFEAEAAARMEEFQSVARRLYENWRETALGGARLPERAVGGGR